MLYDYLRFGYGMYKYLMNLMVNGMAVCAFFKMLLIFKALVCHAILLLALLLNANLRKKLWICVCYP